MTKLSHALADMRCIYLISESAQQEQHTVGALEARAAEEMIFDTHTLADL
jgi:hypothetical protein